MSKEKQILQLLSEGRSQRWIAANLSVSRNTSSKVQTAVLRLKQNYQTLLLLDEESLIRTLFPEQSAVPVLVKPDYEKIHKELLRHVVTLRLLWEEYMDTCRKSKLPPYMYSQFCKLYVDYVDQNRLTPYDGGFISATALSQRKCGVLPARGVYQKELYSDLRGKYDR